MFLDSRRPDTIDRHMPSSLTQAEQAPARFADQWLSLDRWIHRRDLIRELVIRDMKLRYRGSVLGMAWTLLNPLTELLVLLFIFGHVIPMNIPNFAPFLFTGLLVYGWFQTALLNATGAFVSNRDLVRRPNGSYSLLPVVIVASNLVHFLLSLAVLVGLLLFSGIPIQGTIVALPVLMAIQFLVILSLAYPLATAYVWFRDTQYFLRVALQLLFYLTPVFYDAAMIPDRFQNLYRLNPMVTLVDGYRAVLMRGTWPSIGPLAQLTTAAAVVLVIGLFLFRHASQHFADEL